MTEQTDPSAAVPQEDRHRPRREDLSLLDLEGRQREAIERAEKHQALRARIDIERIMQAVRAVYRGLKNSLWDFGPTRLLILAGLGAFLASVLLAGLGSGTLAAFPALIGFGLSLAALLYGAIPLLAARLDALDRPQWLTVWAFLIVLFAFVGFSSGAVIVLVLFVGGFTVTHVFGGLLNRILLERGRKERRGIVDGAGNPNPLLRAFTVIAAWSVGASLLMGFLRVHESSPLGVSFLAAHIGLVLGLVPLQVHLLREARKPTIARWSLFRPARLVRDVVLMAVAGAVVGAELSVASGVGVFSGIPTLALVLVLFGYLGVVGRHLFSLRGHARPYHPFILPAFGMLLLFAPLIVIFSSPPDTLTRLYGAAQAAGILIGVASIFLVGLWQERADRLRARLEQVIREKVPLEEAKEGEKGRYERIGATQPHAERNGVRMTEAPSPNQQEEDPVEET